MKILLFANTEWYLYKFCLSLIRALIERGVEVIALSPPGPYGARLQEAGCRWIPVPLDRRSLNPLKELAFLARLVRLYRVERPDIAHHFTIKCVVYGSTAAAAARVAGVINAVTGLGHVFTDSGWRNRLLRPIVSALLGLCLGGRRSRLIVLNPDDRDAILALRVIPNRAIRMIRGSGVNTGTFSPRADDSHERPARVLLATRLLWDKGVREYVDAARSLLRQGVKAEFLLAGRPDPGNPASVSQGIIDGWDREGTVRALGHVEGMRELLHDVDLVVLPSYREGTPTILVEAAACGLPIVASDVPGCREVVTHGENGFLVPPRDSASLAISIRLLIHQPETRARMGAAGRKKMLAEFDERIVISQTLDVYRELVDVPTGPANAAVAAGDRSQIA